MVRSNVEQEHKSNVSEVKNNVRWSGLRRTQKQEQRVGGEQRATRTLEQVVGGRQNVEE